MPLTQPPPGFLRPRLLGSVYIQRIGFFDAYFVPPPLSVERRFRFDSPFSSDFGHPPSSRAVPKRDRCVFRSRNFGDPIAFVSKNAELLGRRFPPLAGFFCSPVSTSRILSISCRGVNTALVFERADAFERFSLSPLFMFFIFQRNVIRSFCKVPSDPAAAQILFSFVVYRRALPTASPSCSILPFKGFSSLEKAIG